MRPPTHRRSRRQPQVRPRRQALPQAGQQRVALEFLHVVGKPGIAPGLHLRRPPRPVSAITGSPAHGPSARSRRTKASPSMPGISMSETTASTITPESRSRSACAAPATAVTS